MAGAGMRRVVVVGLMMFAIIGLACSDKSSTASTDDYEEEDYSIEALTSEAASSPGSIVAAPIGGPVPPGAFDNANQSSPSGAATLSLQHFYAFAGPAFTTLVAFFYF